MTTDMKPTAFTTTYAPATEESKGAPKGFMLFGVELAYLSFLGGVVAFLGWLVQNTISAATVGVIDSAHVLPFITPFIPVIYALHILLGHPDDVAIFGKPLFASLPEAERKRRSNILAYVIICCAVFFGELAIGNFMDHYFGMQIWDFADLPLSITPYASVASALGIGTVVFLVFKFAYMPMLNFIRGHINYKFARAMVCLFGCVIVADAIYVAACVVFTGSTPMMWQIIL